MVLIPLDELASVVQSAAPLRLGSFVNGRFRNADITGALSARLELACAATLDRHSIAFAFAGAGKPDLLWHSNSRSEAAIEVEYINGWAAMRYGTLVRRQPPGQG